MISPRKIATVAAFVALALRSAPARADGGSGESGVFALGALFWMSGASLGLATDAGVTAHLLSSGGRVPRSWAVTGTVVWSVATVAAAVVVGEMYVVANEPGYVHQSDEAAGFAVGYGILGVSAASLALSIYGLTRPPAARIETSAALLRSLPLILPTPSGGSLLIRGTF